MCGICGIFAFTGNAVLNHESLNGMADTMLHRGPDDSGVYISPDRRVGLGFRRLAIVDLSPAGHQPMSNEDGRVWLVFNGEIYNHAELRAELEAAGHRYHSRADSEAIVHGYEQWGESVVEHLRGMFAFAIYDQQHETLLLARDRLGIKPIYYTHQNGCFLFGSEIKAILAWTGVSREVDEEALYHYLTLAVAPAPLTLFRGVKKLPPGHTISISSNGHTEVRQYWDPVFPDDSMDGMKEDDIVERLRELLRESIRLRMMSDVPFGVFLSGGVDSSLNVALMSELMDRPVDTFSVAIQDDPRSDELSHAHRVAKYFGTNHHEIVITPQDFVDFLPQMVWHQDEPLADPVCVPIYFVSKLARENGTIVIQVGEGSDEIFAGYTGYSTMSNFHQRWYAPFAAFPRWIKRPIASVSSLFLPARKADYIRRAAAGQELFWGGATVFHESAKRQFLLSNSSNGSYDTYTQIVAPHYNHFDQACPDMPFLERIIYLELKHRLPELLLMRVDKMAMATSVETRVPYLDHELVRFALAIPSKLKVCNGATKHILKRAARGLIPDDVIDRPKLGFCGSATNMVSGVLLDYAEQAILNSDWLRGLMNIERIRQRLHEHRTGRRDHGMAIWMLLNLVIWHRRWIEGDVEEVSAAFCT